MDENQEKNENIEKDIQKVEEQATKQNTEPEVIQSDENTESVKTIPEEIEDGDAIKEPKAKKGSYITGTIGAILGGLVGAIPWILTYSFANMIVAALAVFIVGGAYLGYKIFKGRIGKGFPAILTVVSLLVVTIVTTVICPMILIAKSGYNVTFYNLESLYTSEVRENIRTAIIQDLIISLLFTIIGIAAIVRSIKVQIKNGATSETLKFTTQAPVDGENSEENKTKKRNSPVKTIVILVLVVCIVAVAYILLNGRTTDYAIEGTNVKLSIEDNQKLYKTEEEIKENISADAAQYYDFIIEEQDEKYEISGQIISKSEYEGKNSDEIIQEDRDAFAKYFGEEETSAVESKELGGKNFKSYSYNYISTTEKECRTQVYLYEDEENYLWVEVRALREIESSEIDQVIDKLFK